VTVILPAARSLPDSAGRTAKARAYPVAVGD
jgi:hypothetical protein